MISTTELENHRNLKSIAYSCRTLAVFAWLYFGWRVFFYLAAALAS